MRTGIFRLRRTTGLPLLAIVGGLVLLAGCAGGGDGEAVHDDDHTDVASTAYLEDAPKDRVIEIAMTEFHFGESAIEIEAGEIIELVFTNDGLVLHDFTIERMHADVHVTDISGAGHHEHMDMPMDGDTENAVHIALDPGGKGLVHLKAEEGGEFVFYCSVPGHREGGMVGTLTVHEGDGHVDDDHAAPETDGHDEQAAVVH